MCRGIARVGFLLSYHRSTDLGRISHPQFVVMGTEDPLEPWCVDRGFHAHTGRTRKCGVKLLRLTALVFQTPLNHLARAGIQHGNLLKARVKITAYNHHRSAPFLRALVE